MKEREIYMKLFDISINTYYKWKKEQRPIITLMEKYFSKNDLEEYVMSGHISRLDFYKQLEIELTKQDYILVDFLKEFSYKQRLLILNIFQLQYEYDGMLKLFFNIEETTLKEDYEIDAQDIEEILEIIENSNLNELKKIIDYGERNDFQNFLHLQHILNWNKSTEDIQFLLDIFIEYNIVNHSNSDFKFKTYKEMYVTIDKMKAKYSNISNSSIRNDENKLDYIREEIQNLKDEFKSSGRKERLNTILTKKDKKLSFI